MLSVPCLLLSAIVSPQPNAPPQDRIEIRVPGTAVPFELALCPAGTIESDEEQTTIEVDAMWALTTEVTWDLYDIYVYELDEPEEPTGVDAVSRPSKPYVPPDRGFGHDGYPAIGMTRKAAEGFCGWLSLKTGLDVRLPTQIEWVYLASGGTDDPFCCGVSIDTLDQVAWYQNNSAHTTHPVGQKKPNAFGLHDVHGNAAEWVMTDTRRPYAMGGGYRDSAEDSTATSAQRQVSAWNQSDPQIPKSQWWLADCSWVGFRFVVNATEASETRLEELRHE
ncbi:MAG: formylglycine-generating enzyme family protein [bacterium]|nr:formylglycine-generating enzyme family protein [bacterium]